jgi:N-acetyl-alpha-D-muramate 1-phosphate uridylyltransferase
MGCMDKMIKPIPQHAMVLAAGLGTRMRPLTDKVPKPMITVNGKSLIDYVLDGLAHAGVSRAVVNVHYMADMLEQHLSYRTQPQIVISDERDFLLGTGGGVMRALPHLGNAPFFHINSDTIWIDRATSNLVRLAEIFDANRMDALLLLAPAFGSIGYNGRGDYVMTSDGNLCKRDKNEDVPFVYAGAAILSPILFRDTPSGDFSLTILFDRVEKAGRLFGLLLDGLWMHVGTPQAIAAAEAAIKANIQIA